MWRSGIELGAGVHEHEGCACCCRLAAVDVLNNTLLAGHRPELLALVFERSRCPHGGGQDVDGNANRSGRFGVVWG